MEVFLAVTSLALQLSNKCKGSSKRFRCLGNDLTVFHLVLKDTQQYLSHPRLRHIRIECESLAEEIDDMLSEHAERNRLERFCHAVAKDPPGDILELQRRLQWTVTVLTLFVTTRKQRACAGSRQSLNETLRLMDEIWVKSYHDLKEVRVNEPFMHIETTEAPCAKSSLTSSAPNSSRTSLACTSSRASRASVSSRSVSTISTQTDISPPITPSESQRSVAVGPINLKLCDQLIAISKSPKGTPIPKEEVRHLLHLGASFEATDSVCYRTPFIWAIVAGNRLMVEFFLSEQAEIETRDRVYRYTPLIWAVVENQIDILDILIGRNADLTATDSHCGRTALHWAAAVGHYNAARLLVKAKRELVNARDQEGMTPLAVAYKEGRDWMTACLCIKSGSDVNFRFSNGQSLLECARSQRDADFANLLVRNGAAGT